MKTLVFSDTHLSPIFDEKKCSFLLKIIKDCDNVIINGDFWEAVNFPLEKFILSPYRILFPILKNKNTIYIYGNHDKIIFQNGQTRLFSNIQTDRYLLKFNGNNLIFEHGNKILPFIDDRINSKYYPKRELAYLSDHLEKIIIKTLNKTAINTFQKLLNRTIKKRIGKKLKANEIYICGHTHSGEIDLKNQFINNGFIRHGLAQFLLIEDNKFKLKEEYYE